MFNPNEIAKPNGNYFGFPYTIDTAKVVLLPVPWDVTTSYKPGASKGPKAILDASLQLDFFDFDVANAWQIGVATLPEDEAIIRLNADMRPLAEQIIGALEEGHEPSDHLLFQVNQASELINGMVYQAAKSHLMQGLSVGLVGGDHSTPLGLMQALAEQHDSFGILHIDAHADLREAYEGFTYSHASIMYNALRLKQVKKLVQVALRDVCEDEVRLAQNSEGRVLQFNDFRIRQDAFGGKNWEEQVTQIIGHLPDKVYVSFDIDGLSPDLCPYTGTPVPGGLSFQEAVYLIKKIRMMGKTMIGFDLCEVAPGKDEWDANVGARILYKLCNLMAGEIKK